MAVKGNFAGYQALRPLEQDFSEDLQRHELNKIRWEQLNQQKENERQRRKDRIAENTQKGFKTFDTYTDTGDKDVNAKMHRIALEARKRYGELGMRLAEGNIEPKEEAEIRLSMNSLMSVPSQMKQMASGYTTRISGYKKGVNDRSIHQEEEWEGIIDSINNNKFDFGFTPDNELFVKFRDGDGNNVLDTETFSDFISDKESIIPEFTPVFNLDAAVKNTSELVGTAKRSRERGDFIKKTTQDIRDPEVLRKMSVDMFIKNGVPTAEAISLWRQGGGNLKDLDGDAIKIMQDNFFDRVSASKNKLDLEDKDYAAENRASKERNKKGKIFLKKNEDGTPIRSQAPGDDRTFYSLSKYVNHGPYVFHSVYNDSDQIALKGVKKYKDEDGKNQEESVVIDDKQIINNVMAQMGYDDMEKLKETIESQLEGVEDTDPSEIKTRIKDY